MTYSDVLTAAREALSGVCAVCPVCDGKACRGQIPGVGGKGSGRAFTVCREFLDRVTLNMDVIHPHFEADTSVELFGRKFAYPFFAAPIGGMKLNYGGLLSESDYVQAVVDGTRAAGTFAWTGDGPDESIFQTTLPLIEAAGGAAVPTIKPWAQEKCLERIRELEDAGAMAFAMDVDSAALINLKLMGKPVFTKSTEELRELVEAAKVPFVVKGVMTPAAALRCAEAGCYGIVVSSHGGRVMEDAPAPASRLREIRKAVGASLKIFVDGGVRSGADVFKCLALGADAVLVGRPYAIAAFGGGAEGVQLLTEKLGAELAETMLMTGCRSLEEISESCLEIG
ncbi:MAG: alpha-hydroxy-acid oxidizing protein [Firmicutes bacterium]|nr:alpha-hydroxy-acid oxidizing protein [Bacillota bacterium]